MRDHSVVAVPDIKHILHAICGPYDEHLKIIEKEFKAPVRISNEDIRLETEDLASQEKFKDLCNSLFQIAAAGTEISKTTIHSLLITGSDDVNLKKMEIVFSNNVKIQPKTERQKEFLEHIRNKTVIFGIGPAGTGKTYLSIAQGLKFLQTRTIQRLIYTRPVVETGESLGYLPGDVQEKISPYMRPFFDILKMLAEKASMQRFIEDERIELVPLAYMRGRDIQNSLVILDEAQNATDAQMKMLLTRIGLSTQLVVIGDPQQSDRTIQDAMPLERLVLKLEHIDSVSCTRFTIRDCVRSKFVQKVLQVYDAD